MNALRNACRDFLELFLLPAFIATLPWTIGLRMARAIARRKWFYEGEARAALAVAKTRIVINGDEDWLYRYCFTRLMDHVDLYTSLVHGREWVGKALVLHGAWPTRKPFVAMTFHWGGGLLALRSLQYATGPFAGVVLAVDKAQYRGHPIQYAYVRLRNWETARAVGNGLNFTGNTARSFVTALSSGVSICGLFDVPPAPGVKSRVAAFLGANAIFPRGAARLASRHAVPLVIFRAMTDPERGRHEIWIESPALDASEDALFGRAVASLEEAVRAQPAAWHMWSALDSFNQAATK